MSHPFGAPFGSNPSAASPFGQPSQMSGQISSVSSGFGTSTTSGIFGQPSQQQSSTPLFGQIATITSASSNNPGQTGSGFSSTGLFQSTNPGFNQNTSPGFGQTPTFGQVSGASVFSSPGFGKDVSVGGQTTTTAPLFGKPVAASGVTQSGQVSGFGQPAGQPSSNMFGLGQSKSTSAFTQVSSPLFGKPSSSSLGPSSSQKSTGSISSVSTVSPFPSIKTPTLFGKPMPTSSATTGLGVNTTSQSPFSSFPTTNAPSLFGKPTKQPSVASTSQSTLFGKPVSTSAFTAATSSGFGKSTNNLFAKSKEQPASNVLSQNQDTKSTNLFSQSTGFKPSSEEKTLFGKVPIQAAGAGNFSSLFGKNTVSKSESPESSSYIAETKQISKPSGLFGKGESSTFIKSEPRQSIVKSEHPSMTSRMRSDDHSSQVKSESNTALFGVKQETEEDFKGDTYGGLFGKDTKSDNVKSFGLFGKEKNEPSTSHRGRYQINRNTRSGEQGRPDRGLFGKGAAVMGRRPFRSGSDDKDQPNQLRRQISEDISSKVAIICRNLGPRVNNTHVLRAHFRRFGEVTKVFPNPAKGQATVHFKTHEAAAEAKRRGRQLSKDSPPMTIFWSSYTGPGTPRQNSRETERQPSRPVKRNIDAASLPRSKRTTWHEDGEVNEELEGMAGTQDMYRERRPSPQPGTSGTMQQQLPEKRARTASPVPADVKGEKSVDLNKLNAKEFSEGKQVPDSVIQIRGGWVVPSMFEGVMARTTTERVHLLNLRDRYIRHHRIKKDRNISTATAFHGICQDMCPERERYDREDKRRLCVYEMLAGTENIPGKNPVVDHSRAVKEYIRSSPDQDEPLPHELRPLPVLTSTMKFLLRDVANQGRDGHWADWFDYLWNRTRGIRKDITQQQLCDRGTVALIEKCARFHVFCSERLCEEDMHAFDAKINNENLTKCLQTLKEMYYDLEEKQNCFCPCEAEFRAYYVLMNLNDGDILRQVQELRPMVRTSPAIKFALQVYRSLNSNNYIKFFRLVKEASFGQACTMHRYFNQVRNRALQTMMKGYGMGNRPAQIPLSNLVKLLGFENEMEAQDFCEYYGFNVVDREAVLDRMEYIEPETAWPARRSSSLIESKLMVSIGEMINGEPFTNEDGLHPSSSFDMNDRFHSLVPLPTRGHDSSVRRAPAVSQVKLAQAIPQVKQTQAVPQVKQVHAVPQVKRAQPIPQVEQTPEEPVAQEGQVESEPSTSQKQDQAMQKMHTTEGIKVTAKILFWEVIEGLVKDIANETMTDVQYKMNFASSFMDSMVSIDVSHEIETLCQEVYDEEQEKHQKALKQEREARRERVALMLTGDIIEDLINQEALNLATIEIREVKTILRKQCVERVTVDINEAIIAEVFQSLVEEVSDDVFETDVTQRLEELDKFEKIVKLSSTARFWKIWKKEYKAVTKLKRAMQDFPSSANMEDAACQVKRLIHVNDRRIVDKQFFVDKHAKLTLESPIEINARAEKIETQFTVHALYQRLLHHTAWQHLDMTRLVGKILAKNMSGSQQTDTSTMYWKLILCMPDEDENSNSQDSRTTKHLCDWLRAKLSKGKTPPAEENTKSKVISLYKSKVSTTTSVPTNGQQSLGVCIRTVSGTLDIDDVSAIEEERLLLGTSGLVLVLPKGAPLHDSNAPFWKEHSTRLQQILMVKPMYQELALVVVVPVAANQKSLYKQVIEYLSVEEFISEGLLCDSYVVKLLTDDIHSEGINLVNPECSEKLCEGLQWLAERTRPPPTLAVLGLKDFLEDTLLELYYTPTQQSLKKRKVLGYMDKDPISLISLYNNVIDHVADTLVSDSLSEISWPVTEFVRTSQGVPPAHWNSQDHFEYLQDHINNLKLPQFCPRNPDTEEWSDVKIDLWQYVSMVTGRSYGPPRVTLHSRLKRLLLKVEEDFEETCFLQEGEDNCEPTYINVPWSRFISHCIDYRLATTDFYDPILVSAGSSSDSCELRVAYDADHLERYRPLAEWRHVESEKSILETPSFNATVQQATFKAREKKAQAPVKLETSIVEDPHNVSLVSVKAKKSSSGLIRSLHSERRCSDHFQKYLENAVKLGAIDSTSLSDSVFLSDTSMEFSRMDNPRLSFDATDFFNRSQNSLAGIFDETVSQESSILTGRRRSDIGSTLYMDRGHSDLQELSRLQGKKRRDRLSEIFPNDQVMLCLNQPSLTEDLDSFKQNLKSSRRESDLFDKRLQSLLTNTPMDVV